MTYNTKYILNYCNKDGVPLRVEIQGKDYVGEAFIIVNQTEYLQDIEGNYVTINRDGSYDPSRDMNSIVASSNPLSLTYQNDIGEKGGAIRATVSTMSFYEDMMFNIDDLATSDETALRCVFYYDDEVEWIGFVVPDFFNVPIEENPVINLIASDRIGILKDISYNVPDLTTDDRVSYLNIISKCLLETGLQLNINVVCDLKCDMFTGVLPEDANCLVDSFVSELRFVKDEDNGETESCYEVIKSICDEFNCLITQRKGEWWIFNKENLEIGDGDLFRYTSDGQFIDKYPFMQNEITFSLIDTGGERTLMPAGSKNTYLLDNGVDLQYPLNRSLKRVINDDSTMINWYINSGFNVNNLYPPDEYFPNGLVQTNLQKQASGVRVTHSEIMVVSDDTVNITPVPGYVYMTTPWMLQSEKFKVVTFDGNRTDFKLTISAVGKPYTAAMIGLILEFNDDPINPRYAILRAVTTQNGREFTGEYEFLFMDSAVNLMPMVPIMFDDVYKNSLLSSSKTFSINVSAANGQNQNYDLNKAKMFVRIYPNVAFKKSSLNPNLNNITSFIKSITVDFTSDDQIGKGTVFQSILSAQYTKPTAKRTVMFGDYQTEGQNGFFYRGREDSLSIHYNSNGERLKDWYTSRDTERNPLLIHALRQLTRSYGRPHDELRIGFEMNRIDPFSKYAIKCGNKYLNGKKFILVEGAIDYLRSSFVGVLAQVRTGDVENTEYIYSYFNK